jgi:hypothetical protein
MTFILSLSFWFSRFPSKQSGPSPLLKLDCFVAWIISSVLNRAVVFIYSSTISVSSADSVLDPLLFLR